MATRILILMCASVWVSVAWGLGLGSLEVQSNLDQPLDGVIELRLAEGDDLASIDARIASRDEFEDLGIDYPTYLGSVRLVVEQRAGESVLRLLSDSVINEPFVHLLIRVDWSGGSFLREYTALIDPPVYAAEAPPSISQPRIIDEQASLADTQTRFTSESAPESDIAVGESITELSDDYTRSEDYISFEDTQTVASAPSSSASGNSQINGDFDSANVDAQYGPVVAGESLSQIASDLQSQFPDLSIYQIMKVMFEENRSSFIEGNINGLLMGSILKIGDINAIRAVDLAEARDFYRTQLQDWDPVYLIADSQRDSGFSSQDDILVSQDDYAFSDDIDTDGYQSSGSDSAGSISSDADLFRVGAASDADTFVSASDSRSNSNNGEVVALRSQITQLETTIASSDQENRELTERISILEGQLSDLNRLMSLGVEDADLANLEASLAAQNNNDLDDNENLDELASTDIQSSDALTGFEELNDEFDDDGLQILDLDAQDDSAMANAESSSQVQSIVEEFGQGIDSSDNAEAQPVPTRTIEVKGSQGFVGTLWESLQDSGVGRLIAGVGGVLLAGLALLVYRRRRADEEFEISMLSIETNSTTQIQDDNAKQSGFDSSVTEEAQKGDKETSFLTVYSDSDAVVQADEVDPIAEADVYIAYGRDEQAEEVLLDGIAGSPERVDIKQKLLGLYHKNENTQGFERVAEELYGQRDTVSDSDWAMVVAMGREISPENPLFDDHLAKPTSSFGSGVSPVRTELDTNNSDALFDIPEQAASDEESEIALVQFDDVRSQLSELDQVEINALDVPTGNNVDPTGKTQTTVSQAPMDHDLLYDLDEELTLDADNISYDIDDQEFDQQISKPKDPLEEPSLIDFSETPNQGSPLDDDEPSVEDTDDAMSDLDIASSYDEARTQYELAKVFVDLGDEDGAKKILRELAKSDDIDDDVLSDAIALLDSIDA